MKKRMHDLVIVGISIIMICINNISLSKYDDEIKCNVNSEIAKGIIEVEKDEMIEQSINQTTFPIEYHFWVNNYRGEIINEVDFEYVISIENSVENFPVSCSLVDCANNKEISLMKGKSETIKINKFKKESREFKLYLQWREIDGELAEDVEIKIKVDAVQSKKGA